MKLPFISRWKYDDLLDDIKIYQIRLDKKQGEIDEKTEKLNCANKQIVSLTNEIVTLQQNRQRSKSLQKNAYNKRRREKSVIEKKISNLESALELAKTELQKVTNDNAKLTQEKNKCLEIINSYEEELKKIKRKPKLEDLKLEKCLKTDEKRIIGGKFSKTKKQK